MSEPKNFINFHVLISHSPSCLNRDDQNMQKRAVFGGVERIRISSQSLKREMRKPPENAFNYWKSALGDPSVRTRNPVKIAELFSKELEKEYPKQVVERAAQLFLKASTNEDDIEDDAVDEIGSTPELESIKKIAVAPWVLAEIREICNVVDSVKLTEEEMTKAKEKCSKQKGKKKQSEEVFIEKALIAKIKKALEPKKENLVKALGTAVDVALWGRMATSGLMTSVDGSLAVAHAITTHAAQADTDWFTAVDDLVQDSGEVGAGHLDTQEFSSGVFYRYASLNILQLQKNLGGASRDRALEIAKHVFHMLCTVVPSAKQQSFAAHNSADFAIVSFADQPISMANAYEQPIEKAKAGGYYKPSVEKLMEFWKSSNGFYNLQENAACCSKDIAIAEGLTKKKSLLDVETWISHDGN
ncbi:MAG TPA: type I-E CRISPR-associated protein Cas7/Cse4/CasC [Fibrobacteres bacterium]|jgi:CRISPR system Cascade subunit CasC|nr:type I-E CRISPR-associated protein Cas7/Cse4/CasC [Fibrobacterota bacterium]